FAIGLVLTVVIVISASAYREVRRTAITSANRRLESVSHQLGELFGASARQALEQMRTIANDTAIAAFLRDRSETAGRAALRRLSRPSASAATPAIEIWGGAGQRLLTTQDTMPPLSTADSRLLIE